jgi:hypothetical protein
MERKVVYQCLMSLVSLGVLSCSSTDRATADKTVGSVVQRVSDPSCSGTIQVSALIDGQSLLHIIPDGIYWEHISKAGPGLHASQTLPTSVTATIAGTTTSTDWCPIWENGCNTCDGSCGELRDPMFANPFFLQVLPKPLQHFELSACNGRNTCTLAQAPDASNGFDAIIDFDDVDPPGPAYYSATVSYDFCAPCSLRQYTTGTRFIGSPVWADESFFPSLDAIEAAAASSNVSVYITNSFRQAGHTLEGAIVPPARMSNHLAGHAIDMNVQYTDESGRTVLATSAVLGQADLPAPVASFISAVKAAGLRWGGDFQPIDVVHFDDGFNGDSTAWQSTFDALQGCAESAGMVARVHSPVNIMITDPAGRVLGVDDAGNPVNSIGADGTDSGPVEPRTFAIRKPLPGNYTIRAFGTGTGPYTIDLFDAIQIGAPLESVAAADEGMRLTGNANVGMVRTVSFALSPEEPKMMRDLTAPQITASADRSKLWPPNGNKIPVTISGTVEDDLSGVAPSSVRFQVTDEYGSVQPEGLIAVDTDGRFTVSVPLTATRQGNDRDGRRYTITIVANDNDGNSARSEPIIVTVPHDQGKSKQ